MKTYKLYGEEKTFAEVKEFLDKYYSAVKKEGKKHRIAHFLELINDEHKVNVLDYGCGWGIFSKLIQEKSKNLNVEGIDLDPMSLSIAKDIVGELESLHFFNKKIIDYANKSFDYVLSMQVIEHVHNPGNYLREINRVLRDDGHLIISLPNVTQPNIILQLLLKSSKKLNRRLKERSELMLSNYKKEHDHIQAWDPYHFVTLLASLGFEFQEVRMVEGVPLPFIKYWHTKIFGIKNLSYKMVFLFKKIKEVEIDIYD